MTTNRPGLYMTLKKYPSTVKKVGTLSIAIAVKVCRNGDVIKHVQVFHTTPDRVPEYAAIVRHDVSAESMRALVPTPNRYKFKIADVPEDLETSEDLQTYVTTKTIAAINALLDQEKK